MVSSGVVGHLPLVSRGAAVWRRIKKDESDCSKRPLGNEITGDEITTDRTVRKKGVNTYGVDRI